VARPIFLIGFMGSGKTTVGRLLAARLGLRHADLDRRIEAELGPLLPFIQREGEEAFRAAERRFLLDALKERDIVLSLGGGTPTQADTMDLLLGAGTVVFIDAPVHELQERLLKKGRDRPLLFGLSDDALRTRVTELLAERLPVYRRAQVVVDGSGTLDEVTDRIIASLT
jgi:shikimate kinase